MDHRGGRGEGPRADDLGFDCVSCPPCVGNLFNKEFLCTTVENSLQIMR